MTNGKLMMLKATQVILFYYNSASIKRTGTLFFLSLFFECGNYQYDCDDNDQELSEQGPEGPDCPEPDLCYGLAEEQDENNSSYQ